MTKNRLMNKGSEYLIQYKMHLNKLTQKERNICFLLILNLFINIILYFRTYGEGDSVNSKAFFPFFRYHDYNFYDDDTLAYKYFEAYSREELFYYGVLPLLSFYVWFYFFKGKK